MAGYVVPLSRHPIKLSNSQVMGVEIATRAQAGGMAAAIGSNIEARTGTDPLAAPVHQVMRRR
jgi:hypothetical protein